MYEAASNGFQSFSQIAIPLWVAVPVLLMLGLGLAKLVKILFLSLRG